MSGCHCGRSGEGQSEKHGDGTITFHTFARCVRVNACEHTVRIRAQEDVNKIIGADGRCVGCAKGG
jgi:hypothetical protein